MEKVKGFLALPGTFQERLGREHVLPSVGKGIGVYFFSSFSFSRPAHVMGFLSSPTLWRECPFAKGEAAPNSQIKMTTTKLIKQTNSQPSRKPVLAFISILP